MQAQRCSRRQRPGGSCWCRWSRTKTAQPQAAGLALVHFLKRDRRAPDSVSWYSLLCRCGGAAEGGDLAAELSALLTLLTAPAAAQPWLCDWLWRVYREVLQPFLVLAAGPAADSAPLAAFRAAWTRLPWSRATFHCISPGAALDSAAMNGIQGFCAHWLLSDLALLAVCRAWSYQARPALSRPSLQCKDMLTCMLCSSHMLTDTVARKPRAEHCPRWSNDNCA